MNNNEFKMNPFEAASIVKGLKVGDLMYTPTGDKVVISEIESSTAGNVKFWYVDSMGYNRVSSDDDLIERFMGYGPIDNDPIIVHNEIPKVKIQNVKTEVDMVNSLSHCTTEDIKCIEAIKASMTPEAFRGYLKGNVMKYLWRYEKGINPTEDLKKVSWYQDQLIKEVSSGVE